MFCGWPSPPPWAGRIGNGGTPPPPWCRRFLLRAGKAEIFSDMTERLVPPVAIGHAALPSMQNPRPSTPHRLDLKGPAGLLQDPDKGPRRVALGGLGLRTFQRGPDKL